MIKLLREKNIILINLGKPNKAIEFTKFQYIPMIETAIEAYKDTEMEIFAYLACVDAYLLLLDLYQSI